MGQDFFEHARRHLSSLSEVVQRKGIKAAEEHRRADGVHQYELPSSLASRISAAGEEIEAITNVSTIVVSRFRYLSDLLRRMNEVADRVASSATPTRPEHLRF